MILTFSGLHFLFYMTPLNFQRGLVQPPVEQKWPKRITVQCMTPLLLSLSQSHSLEKHWSIIDLVSIKLLKSQLPVIKVTGAATGNCFASLLVVLGYKFVTYSEIQFKKPGNLLFYVPKCITLIGSKSVLS